MEINTQHLEALFQLQEQQTQVPRKLQGQPKGFEELLNTQLNGKPENSRNLDDLALREAQASMLSQVVTPDAEENALANPDEAVIQAAFDQASGTLDLWDKYARTIGASPAPTALRDAWTLLEGIDAQVSQMRANPIMGKNEGLNSLLNELEIMATTEKFKFNRGDYLI